VFWLVFLIFLRSCPLRGLGLLPFLLP
jgi:hypothetical protein